MKNYLSLDLRALAVWRMALGFAVLWDIVLRLRDLQAFYGDQGMLSRRLCFEQTWLSPVYCLFLATGDTPGLLFLFGVWAVAATCLMVGYRTRLAGVVTWYFVVSIQLRNPMVLDGGDDFLRLMLFWTPFLPVAARWSVDAREHPEWLKLPNAYRSLATMGVTLQFFLLYLFAAILKNGEDWRKTGDALYFTLSIDQFTTRLGQYLVQHPDWLRPLTWGALGLEFVLPLLLLLPNRRPFLVVAAGFHLGIMSTLHFGLFMPIMLLSLTAFLPAGLFKRFQKTEPPVTEVAGDEPPAYSLERPLQVIAAFILFYMVYVNIYSIKNVQKLAPWAHAVARYTYEHQHWHFFAPMPFREDGYFVLEVISPDGKVTDGLQNGPVDKNGRPLLGSARFANQRWRRWMQNLIQIDIPDNVGWRKSTLEFLARRWMQEHPEAGVSEFRLVFMEEFSMPPGVPTSLKRVDLAQMPAPQKPLQQRLEAGEKR